MKVSTRLVLLSIFILRVCCFNPVAGSESGEGYWAFIPGSPPLYLKILLTWRIIVCGQDMMLFNLVILRYPLCGILLKLCFISAAKLCYEMFCNNSLTLLFCFRSVCYGCMNPTTYVWVTCRDP